MSNPQVVNFNVGAIIKSLRDARFTSVNISVQKATTISVTLGIVLLGILARYLRRRKGSYKFKGRIEEHEEVENRLFHESRQRSPSIRSIRRQGSVLSGVSGASEHLSRRGPLYETPANLTPQQLGVMA